MIMFTFEKDMKKQLDQGRRAQFSILINTINLDLTINIQTKRFEWIVRPILLYGSKVWGLENDRLEIFYIHFSILKWRPSTPNCIIYREVGNYHYKHPLTNSKFRTGSVS